MQFSQQKCAIIKAQRGEHKTSRKIKNKMKIKGDYHYVRKL